MPRHPESSQMRGISDTPHDPRTKPAAMLRLDPPDRWPSATAYLSHLSREHDLAFERGDGGVRLYNTHEVKYAAMDCDETCGAGVRTAHQAKIETVILERKRPKRRPRAAAAAPAGARDSQKPAPILGTQEKTSVTLSPEQVAIAKGLVSGLQISNKYGKTPMGETDFTLIARLKRHGLTARDMHRRFMLFDPQQVDEIAERLGYEARSDWPTGIAARPHNAATAAEPPPLKAKQTITASEFLVGKLLSGEAITEDDVEALEHELCTNYRLEPEEDGATPANYRPYRLQLSWQLMLRDG